MDNLSPDDPMLEMRQTLHDTSLENTALRQRVEALESERMRLRLALSLAFQLQPELGMRTLLREFVVEPLNRDQLEQKLAAAQELGVSR